MLLMLGYIRLEADVERYINDYIHWSTGQCCST